MTVHLVGAGCGGPLWLVQRGRELIESAAHIVYDSLIHPDLLQLAPEGCAFHPVGKRKGRPSHNQGDVNRLLVELGATGASVVRLKGGDPFIFGRGGEEAQALNDAGVPWTYTPGITAAIGGLGAAGIPPTHRGVADSLTLVTGHSAGGASPDEDLWRTLGSLGGTKAIYMGASSWRVLLPLLLQGGMSPDEPCSAVIWGGWGRSRLVSFPSLDSMKAPSPCVLALGEAARLNLAPERGVLNGLQVAVVRPFPESWETARILESLGADAYSIPLLRPQEIFSPGDAEMLASADWVVLTSPRGAALLPARIDPRRIRGRIAAIGEGTSAALSSFGILADSVPEEATSEALAALLSQSVKPSERVAFFRNEAGSPLPQEAVASAGAIPVDIAAYRMRPCLPPAFDSYVAMWEECGLDAVVFGSAALADAWSELAPPPPPDAYLIAWGRTCAEAVKRRFGREPIVMKSADVEGLTEALKTVQNRRYHDED